MACIILTTNIVPYASSFVNTFDVNYKWKCSTSVLRLPLSFCMFRVHLFQYYLKIKDGHSPYLLYKHFCLFSGALILFCLSLCDTRLYFYIYLKQSHFRYLVFVKSAHSTYVLSSPPLFCTYYGNNSLYANDKAIFHPVMFLVLIAFITVINLRVLFLTHPLQQLLQLVTGSIIHLLFAAAYLSADNYYRNNFKRTSCLPFITVII